MRFKNFLKTNKFILKVVLITIISLIESIFSLYLGCFGNQKKILKVVFYFKKYIFEVTIF